MSDTIRPALSPEQWADVAIDAVDLDSPGQSSDTDFTRLGFSRDVTDGLYVEEFEAGRPATAVHVHPRARHALAALALHGQPFGFTPAHLDAMARCRWAAYTEFSGSRDERAADEEALRLMDEAMSVIRALLPPAP